MSDRLYKLLPAFTRLRDAGAGRVVEALTGILSDELDRVEENIEDLYDNWFIETCAEWVVPYIGDLLGVGPQYAFDARANSLRPFVAQTLGLRRRKGTVAMLETLGHSVTAWPTRAVEFFQLLATTQHLNHLRPGVTRTPNLRDTNSLELLGGPFERAGRFAEVRRVVPRRGRYNVPELGLFVWRLLSLDAIADGDWSKQPSATADLSAGPGRFRFSPLGHDLTLFSPQRTVDVSARVEEPDVPGPLRRRPLFDELRAARAALSTGEAPHFRWFAEENPVLRLRVIGESADIPPSQLQICDLSAWAALPAAESVPLPDGGTLTTRVSVDPKLGRLAFLDGTAPDAVWVNYHYGFSAETGGGCYDRSNGFGDETGLERYLVRALDPTSPADSAFSDAVAQWLGDGRPPALFEFADSAFYGVSDLSLLAGGRVVLRAADHQRPVLRLGAPWRLTLDAGAELQLDGLLISGAAVELEAVISEPASEVLDHDVSFRHCTLVPGLSLDQAGAPLSPNAASLSSVATSVGRLSVKLSSSITGRVELVTGGVGYSSVFQAQDSIIDGAGGTAPAVLAHEASIARVTVLGATKVATFSATDSIFTDRVLVERTQLGCVRFSFLKPGSVVPRSYRCQPALAVAENPTADPSLIVARVVPAFTDLRYGQAAYAQLARHISDEIRTGAADGSEMGAFHDLHQPQREANLRAALAEYLRVGLEAGILFVT
jgi:hypothetical protein